MDLHVPPELEAKLSRLAAESGRNVDQVALDLLTSSVDHDEWFRREVEQGRASARDDLERICDFIAKDRPESARRVAETIVQGVGALDTFPERGRRGRVEGTRELVFASLPFVAVYEVLNQVQVLRILHGAQRWPLEP